MKKLLKLILTPFRLLGLALGRINTFILVVLSFYLILSPMGILRRILRPKEQPSSWVTRSPLKRDHFKHQY